ncbi:hypothetical protein B0T10DRAFT_502133 [Thelonectria olida]|uniref:DUF6536 domain-containing protein n=1 Tax=Thelonectria olida TaxID=1576542 RepID=A0A9P9AGK0_9HYPO|nr:hypothetical protein B0T10DRAFT_502133 [Thelonectria olida]
MHYVEIDQKAMDDPFAHPDDIEPENKSFLSKLPCGWKFSLSLNATTATLVLLINVGITIWSATRNSLSEDDAALRTLYKGDCVTTHTLNTIIHLVINIFSSLLLAASNYSMQCLSAPTRHDVQTIHAKGRWMDIGVPSVHNLGNIPWKRKIPWFLLMLSSLPLHLLYNSSVFSSFVVLDYGVWSVRDASAGATPIFSRNFSSLGDLDDGLYGFKDSLGLQDLWNLARADELEKLSPLDCINEYATAFQTSRSNLLLVTDPGSDEELQGIPLWKIDSRFENNRFPNCVPKVYEWICGSPDCENPCRGRLPEVRANASDWRPFGRRVKYCLSKQVPQKCRLHFSTWIMAVVIGANVIKVSVMLWLTFCHPPELLLVIGDAIKSFLSSPDAYSTESCLVTGEQVKYAVNGAWHGPRPWTRVRRRWATAVSRRRWIVSLALYVVLLGVSIFFLVWGINTIVGSHSISTLWKLGFGAASETALISLPSWMQDSAMSMIWVVFFANLPQLCFSFLYFQYNALFTGMLAAREWSTFGVKRRGVRVSSNPHGKQRTRYFLQLPYRWGLPLLLMSILVHWLLSQSIFIVSLQHGDNEYTFYSACGYSPTAIISVILVSFFLVAAVAITGFQRLPTAMPVVGSCSLAIAAACHHHEGIPQPNAPLTRLKWGVTQTHSEGRDAVGHCAFSSDYVEEPEIGVRYA